MSAVTAISPAGSHIRDRPVRLNKVLYYPCDPFFGFILSLLLLFLFFFNSRFPVILSFSRFNSSIFRFTPRLILQLLCLRLAIRFGTSQI